MEVTWKLAYVAAGSVVSVFLGLGALRIWPLGSLTWAQRAYQYWFNFIGSAAGWAAGYYVLSAAQSRKLEIIDLLVALFAIVGMSGYIPAMVNATPAALKAIAERYLNPGGR